jgi:hypothetical protein
VGNGQAEHLLVLRQSRQEKLVSAFEPRVDPAQKPLPPARKRNRNAKKKTPEAGTSRNRI